jgi:hypothetical protein
MNIRLFLDNSSIKSIHKSMYEILKFEVLRCDYAIHNILINYFTIVYYPRRMIIFHKSITFMNNSESFWRYYGYSYTDVQIWTKVSNLCKYQNILLRIRRFG